MTGGAYESVGSRDRGSLAMPAGLAERPGKQDESLRRQSSVIAGEEFCDQLLTMAAGGADLDEILMFVWESTRSRLHMDRLALASYDPDEGLVVTRWHVTSSPQTHLPAGTVRSIRGSSVEPLLDNPHPLLVNDLQESVRTRPESFAGRRLLSEGLRASLTLPLRWQNQVVGFLFLSSCQTSPWSECDVKEAERLALRLSAILSSDLLPDRARYFRTFGIGVHELRNPLCAIQGYASMLSQGLRGPVSADQQEVLRRITRVVRRASGVLDDVLDLTAFETGTLRIDAEPTDLNQFLHAELEDSISDARMKNIRLDLVLPPEPVVAEVDEHRLGQVMSNLISNAIKYSWQGSTVTITLETTARDAVIRVRDEGIGIPRDELPNIFKAWCHGKSRTTGGETSHGIGLLVVKTIVEAHCGRIHVESREGSGTEFSFLLPLVRQQVVTEVSED